ncbi:hypothetical protein CANTEDRAFT_95056, partial [Yamadazyma tenuis ATCC 10573]
MTGTCVNSIKIIGVGSLGLLSGSLAYQSIKLIPQLIEEVSSSVSNATYSNIRLGKFISRVLVGLSTTCFYLAYKYSPGNEKHPYLLYALVGGILSYGYTFTTRPD